MIKAIIIEDEVKGLNNLKNLLRQHAEGVEVIGEAASVASGLELIRGLDVELDLAFLDISLPDGLIFKFLNAIRPVKFEIIFVTAYEEYAIKACEYSSIGYILKPIDPDVLRDAVNRARGEAPREMDRRYEMFQRHFYNPNAFTKMSISAIDGIYFVKFQDIVRFEAEDNYTHIFLESGERITASKTIKSYEELLAPYNFYRVHKSHVINLNYMRMFVKGDGGKVIMDDGKEIEVSRRRRPLFMERIRQLQGGPMQDVLPRSGY